MAYCTDLVSIYLTASHLPLSSPDCGIAFVYSIILRGQP